MKTLKAELLKHYESRKARNPSYSKRAFARDLGTSIGRLSEILSGKKNPGRRLAARFAASLGLDETETNKFMALAVEDNSYQSSLKNDRDVFDRFTSPHFLNLLALSQLPTFRHDPNKIASLISIPLNQIEKDMLYIRELGLLELSDPSLQNTLCRIIDSLHANSSTNAKNSQGQRQLIFAGNSENLCKLENMVRRFERRLMRTLCAGDKDCVYVINFSVNTNEPAATSDPASSPRLSIAKQ